MLCTAENIEYVEFAADAAHYQRLELCDKEQVMACQQLEDGSSLEEKFLFDGGVVAVHHTLTLVAERNRAAVWLEPEFCREALLAGLCAVVELEDGRRLLLGYSERFKAKQPLRIKEIRSSSGCAPKDAPIITMTLESFDTSAAAIYAGN